MTTRPKILLSLDSSWWNRFRLSRFTYGRMLRKAGCKPRPIRFAEMLANSTGDPGGDETSRVDVDKVERLLDEVDGLLLSGGGDVPHPNPSEDEASGADDSHLYRGVKPLRDRFESALLGSADERSMPVLGVCRGAQLMNIHHGGRNHSLRRERRSFRYHRLGRHPVRLVEGSRLWNMVPEAEGRLKVSSYHAHAVETCGAGLRPAAHARDGVVEAIEGEDPSVFKVGVQWHPEWMPKSRNQRRILESFCEAARRRSP